MKRFAADYCNCGCARRALAPLPPKAERNRHRRRVAEHHAKVAAQLEAHFGPRVEGAVVAARGQPLINGES